jgi:DNA-binding transcriptional regulator GbsR (MarR family)
MKLPPLVQTFVLHFGEMGSRWGVNRTVGQIYALLFVSPQPLCADDLVEALGISRSNVSMGLKELQAWSLVRLQHIPGDRREYFSAPEDVFAILRTLAEERKKREFDPTLTLLRETLMEEPASDLERHAQKRMRAMHDLMEELGDWYQDMRAIENERLLALMRLGSRASRLLEIADRIPFVGSRRAGRNDEAQDDAPREPGTGPRDEIARGS